MVLWFRKKRKEKDKNYYPVDSCDLLSEKKRQNKEEKQAGHGAIIREKKRR